MKTSTVGADLFHGKGQMGGLTDRRANERTDGQTEGQTDRKQIGMTKLKVAFRNFAHVHFFICMSPTISPEIDVKELQTPLPLIKCMNCNCV